MSTKIEWAEETWNPIIGCSKVSPGCDNCYAERMAGRLANMRIEGYGDVVKWKDIPINDKQGISVPDNKWNGRTHFVKSALKKPLKWKKPRRIFVCSMGDLFHESVSHGWITSVLEVIQKCPQHTFLILTKRPEGMKKYFDHLSKVMKNGVCNINFLPLSNVMLGVTAENQEMADERIPILLSIPAAKRFVSIEPMLGSVDLCKTIVPKGIHGQSTLSYTCFLEHLDWVIVGGESGPGARPMHPDWVRSIRDQCQAANITFLFKQWGEYGPGSELGGVQYAISISGDFVKYHVPEEWKLMVDKYCNNWSKAHVTLMSRAGKKKAGRLLDGKTYDQYPE